MPNQIFIESVLYSVPNELFVGNDIYKVFLKIINYIAVRNTNTIQSINDATKNINNDITCGNCAFYFSRMLNMLI